ncbi:hypothetical protein HDU87_007565 [Geranomyces variabilis]|uniref:Protein kinase domain-containing protein n=1 Tax=Geranomyces variabilis TaxID=109894 RepID=A0AAD5XUW4_9FUNG|nr:hypothetical protein HDU87_007565 [Geranomyces variabilis]
MSSRQRLAKDPDYLKLLSSSTLNSIGNYVFGKTLGEGTFGKVKLAKHILTGQDVAVKIVDKIHAPTLVREIATWRHMHHPNIVRLYEVLCSESRIYMVMEHCTGGEAFDYICKHGRLDDQSDDARRIVRQLVQAVGYCHDKNFVHRDLKLENVLLTEDLNVKLIDFGFTRQVNTRKLLDTYCGSVAYAAPEMILGKQYSGPQADVWSLGVILYTLLCGYLPFDDDNEATLRQKILDLEYELPDFLVPETKDLIQQMLKLKGSERISIQGVLAHSWLGNEATASTTIAGGMSQESTSSAASSTTNFAIQTPEELALLRRLTLAGIDVSALMRSVRDNVCDSSSALWYLLLAKQEQSSGTQTVADSSDSQPWQLPAIAIPGYDSSPLNSPLATSPAPEINSGDYLARMRKKTLGELTREEDSGTVSNSSSPAGRRGLIMNAMRGAGGGAGSGGPGRRRLDKAGRAAGEATRPAVVPRNRSSNDGPGEDSLSSSPSRERQSTPPRQGWVETEAETETESKDEPRLPLSVDDQIEVEDFFNLPHPSAPRDMPRPRPHQGLASSRDRHKGATKSPSTWLEEEEEEEGDDIVGRRLGRAEGVAREGRFQM